MTSPWSEAQAALNGFVLSLAPEAAVPVAIEKWSEHYLGTGPILDTEGTTLIDPILLRAFNGYLALVGDAEHAPPGSSYVPGLDLRSTKTMVAKPKYAGPWNAYALEVEGTIGDRSWAIVLNMCDAGGGAKPNHTVSAMAAAAVTPLAQLFEHCSSAVAGTQLVVRDLSSADEPTAVQSLSFTGNDDRNAAGAGTAYLLQHTTALGGRSYRGRTYLPGIPVDNLAANGQTLVATVAASVEADYANFINALNTALGTNPVALCIVSRVGTGPVTVVTETVCEGTAATQRRRLRK